MAASFFTTYKAEGIKLKNTYIYLLAVILSLIIPVVFTIFTIFKIDDFNDQIYNGYELITQTFSDISSAYTPFLYIVTLILACSRLAQVDYKSNTWQLVETLPTSKFNIYFSKVLRIFSILATGLITTIIGSLVASILIYIFVKDKDQVLLTIPFKDYGLFLTRMLVASMFAVSFLYFLSIRFSNFIITFLIGFAFLIAHPILSNLKLLPKWEMYKLIFNTKEQSDFGRWFTYSDYVSISIAVILFTLGYFWYKDKTIKNAFVINKKQTLISVLVAAIFGGLSVYLLSPNQSLPSNKTVVDGSVNTDMTGTNVYFIEPIIGDTLAKTVIKDKSFTLSIPQDITLSKYYVVLEDEYNQEIIMSKNDNITLEFIKKGEKIANVHVKGTRIAENNLQLNDFTFNTLEYYLDNNIDLEKTDFYFKEIEKNYHNNNKNLITSYTSDNYIPRQDYIEQKYTINKVKTVLTYIDYQKKYQLNFNKDLPENTFITDLKKSIDVNNSDLLVDQDYSTYIGYNLTKDDNSEVDDDTKLINAIKKLPQSKFKDILVFSLAKMELENTTNPEKIKAVESNYLAEIKNPKAHQNLTTKINEAFKISTGSTAPQILATTLDGKQISLQEFSGKYVVIDVWATWCGPCKFQSPKFDKVANQYKNNSNVVFAAISIDKNIQQWLIEAKDKKVNVKQLHATNIKQFSKDYSIKAIPRFILLGPEGQILSSKLPEPSSDEFEQTLKNLIKS